MGQTGSRSGGKSVAGELEEGKQLDVLGEDNEMWWPACVTRVDKKKNELEKQHHPYRTYKINYPFLDYEPHTDTYKKWINRFNVEYNVEYIPEVSKEESYRIP